MLAIVEFEILSKGPHPDPATSVLVARAAQRQARVRFATRVSWVEVGERLEIVVSRGTQPASVSETQKRS
jgi:hypothetical protein